MFNILTKKHGKTYKREIESIKQKIVKARDRGVCDSEGRTIEKNKQGPREGAGKGDRDRVKHKYDIDDLCKRAEKNVWQRDKAGNGSIQTSAAYRSSAECSSW